MTPNRGTGQAAPDDSLAGRRDRRHALEESDRARIRFCYPGDAADAYDCRLTDLSVAGLSFAAERSIPGLQRGCKINGVTLSIRGVEIEARLLVMSVMPFQRRPDQIGAVLYPSTEEDLDRLSALIDDLDRR